MVQAEKKSANTHNCSIEQTSSTRILNTSEKLSSILNNCTLRDITQLLDPEKNETHLTLVSPLPHISYTVMTEHTNSIQIHNVLHNHHKPYNLRLIP